MTTKRFNGHRSWNAWNVNMWISNDEPLYHFAQDCLHRSANTSGAARRFLHSVGEGSKTPDGGVYNFKCVCEALANLAATMPNPETDK